LHQYVTHNRYYPSQKQFANAILAFMRVKPSRRNGRNSATRSQTTSAS
jgi:hypothetical protein